jgi:hypothetical protein
MSNTPFAYAVCSVLHRSVEFKVDKCPRSSIKSKFAIYLISVLGTNTFEWAYDD